MTEQPQRDESTAMAEEAMAWRTRLATGDASDQAAFWDWARRAPSHLQEYILTGIVFDELPHLSPNHRVDDEDSPQRDRDASMITADRSPGRSRTRSIRFARALAAGLMVLVASLVAWWLSVRGRPEGPLDTTNTGELRTLPLEDGSTVVLDAQSSVVVHF
jgi:ferric-dicitrate binding protein FerR (iron transport regulator)